MTSPYDAYGVADPHQPLTDFERAAGVQEPLSIRDGHDSPDFERLPVTPSDHANALTHRLAEVLTPTCTATSFSAPHQFDGTPFDNSDNDWELCEKPADDPIHTSRPGSRDGFIEVAAANAIVFSTHIGKLQAGHVLREHSEREEIRNEIRRAVEGSRRAGTRRVVEVVPMSEDDATAERGAFIVKTAEFDRGGEKEGSAWFQTYLDGRLDPSCWPSRAAALIHLAHRMIDPTGRADDGRAVPYILRMLGHE